MKKDKQKRDKALYKEIILVVLASITLGTVIGTGLLYVLSAILSIKLSLPVGILLGFLIGGGTFGTGMGISISKSLKNDEEEFVEYDEYELDDEVEFKEEVVQDKVSSLKIVKDSGSNYGYKFNDGDKPRLEIVNSDRNQTNKRR